MRSMRLLFFCWFLSACSSMANIDYDKNVNFKSFDTYNIQLKPVRIDDDTRINTDFMLQRIVAAIDTSLEKKGFARVSKKNHLDVKYYLEIKKDLETEDSGVSIGIGSFGHHSAIGFGFSFPIAETYSFDRLVLTIDIFSAETKKLIWRGSLAYRLAEGTRPDTNTLMINELVAEIMKDFPPK